jgi:serine/threonine protein kinase/tetratricopeptide (TPR) repeat protein
MTEARIGKYSIVGEIGRGAMGIVYKGVDPIIGRTVAIKTIRFDTLGQGAERDIAQKRFLREAHSAGNLSHPNIVTIYDVGEDQGLSYIAMEYVDGSSLEELMHARQKFSLDEILRLVEQVADGLESAHKKGVVHRDIKPANILIDSEGRPRIVDFGIARISTSTMTQTNMIMGTPYYMSPEQISGRKVDHRADIFALGGILYELLTGQKAFPGDSLTTVIYKIMNEEPSPVRTFQKSLPEGMDYIVSKALAKAPEERYQNCRELIYDLKHYPQLRTPEPAPNQAEAVLPAPRVFVREARPEVVRPESHRKTLVIILALMLAVTAIVIGVILISPGSSNSSRTRGEVPSPGPAPVIPAKTPDTPAALLNQGRQMLGARSYVDAQATLERIPDSAPEYFDSRLYIASIWEAQDKLGAAASEYRRLIDLNAKDGRPYMRLAELSERKGDKPAALEIYRKLVETSPASVDAEGARWKIKSLEAQVTPPQPTSHPASDQNQAKVVPAVKPVEDKAKPQAKENGKPPLVKPDVKVPEPKPAAADQKPDVKPSVTSEERAADIAQMVQVGKKSLDKKSYSQAVQQLKSVLALDPGNKDARYYLNVAEKKFEEETRTAMIKSVMDQAKAAMRAERYGEAIAQARRALALDPGLNDARKLINSAVVKDTPGAMKALLDLYLQSIRQGDLKGFYSLNGTPEFFQRIKKETEIIFKSYRDIQVSASGLDVDIKDSKFDLYSAGATFDQIMTGVALDKGTRQILFEGKMTWALKNEGGGWKISDIAALTKSKR